MILQYYYCHFTKVLSPEFCSKVVEHGLQQKEQYLDNNFEGVRNSNVVWLDDKWIKDEIYPYIHQANKKAGWNFDWDESEPVQFTKYKKGQFYDWHRDQLESPHGYRSSKGVPKSWLGKNRKLSVTVNLLDEKEYTGGDFEFDFKKEYGPHQPEKCKEIAPIGSIVVFPSFVWHRITPVISGTRYSLVMWTLGPPFK